MKKLVLLTLALAMVISMVGCSCNHQWEAATCQAPKTCTLCQETEGDLLDHTAGQMELAKVDTETLTITYQSACTVCDAVLGTEEASTGIAPVDGRMVINADEWFACLTTNIRQYGASQTLVPHGGESEDNTLVQGVVTLSGMKAAMTFLDTEDTLLLTDQSDLRDYIHTIQVDAQFTNDTASEFYMLIMLLLINNNSSMDFDTANQLASQIMKGDEVADNGYTYHMKIMSLADQMVRLTIVAA